MILKDTKHKFVFFLLVVDELLRFFAPFLLFINPLVAIPANILFDLVDYPLFRFSGFSWETSHRFDKMMDYWWYIVILVFSLISNLPITPIIIVLFLWRSIGQFLTVVSKNEKLLLLFPNTTEWYFDLFIILSAVGLEKLYFTPESKLLLVIPCILFGESVEWVIHYGKPYAKFLKKTFGLTV